MCTISRCRNCYATQKRWWQLTVRRGYLRWFTTNHSKWWAMPCTTSKAWRIKGICTSSGRPILNRIWNCLRSFGGIYWWRRRLMQLIMEFSHSEYKRKCWLILVIRCQFVFLFPLIRFPTIIFSPNISFYNFSWNHRSYVNSF